MPPGGLDSVSSGRSPRMVFGRPEATIESAARLTMPLHDASVRHLLNERRLMSRVKVASFGMSIDGFSAGPRQSLDDPLGVGGASLMAWVFPTRTFQQMHGDGGGETGIDDDFAARSIETEDPRGGTSHGEIGYDRHEGVPVPRDYKVSATNPDGSHSSMRETVVERRFGPVAEDEFNLEALLDGPRGETVAEPDRFDQESESFADWFLIPLGCGIVSLGGGIALLFASNRNTKQTDRIKT